MSDLGQGYSLYTVDHSSVGMSTNGCLFLNSLHTLNGSMLPAEVEMVSVE